jgi:bacillithiol biosynthesis cysteine-adding enzyme BshC
MDCTTTKLSFKQTGYFSAIVNDYLQNAVALQPFYAARPNVEGVKQAITNRQAFTNNRQALVTGLQSQYKGLDKTVELEKNLDLLLQSTTFTITTAHQPNIFTGPLYFLYKIVHAIRLADSAKTLFPEYDFVPVYYMGSEDADLDELGHYFINEKKYSWQTKQTGAVGKMLVDDDLLALLNDTASQVGVQPFGQEIIDILKNAYIKGNTIQQATLSLVNTLFGRFGLVVLIPDNPVFKQQLIPVFKDDLLHHTALPLVEKTGKQLQEAGYKEQAHPREINLFYLADGIRNRIEKTSTGFKVVDTALHFTIDEMILELEQHPERFSPNVILRGIMQETLLPNILFVGGGGELAYWLQLQEVFAQYKVPFPVLLLRNSFLIFDSQQQKKLDKLGVADADIFLPETVLLNKLVKRDTTHDLSLAPALEQIKAQYQGIRQKAAAIDITLVQHVEALQTIALQKIEKLEKKMLRAEKRKFDTTKHQIEQLKKALFPNNNLQERVENFISFYARHGEAFIQLLHQHSPALESEFVLLQVD